jgi:hypothetical protein
MTWVLGVVLKPIFALILFGFILLPARLAVQHWMKPGKLKDWLLTDLKRPRSSSGPEQDLRQPITKGRLADLPEPSWRGLLECLGLNRRGK